MNNPMADMMINLISSGGNPEQMILQYLQNMNNPIGNNLAAMARSNDQAGLEQFARNICAQRGLDFDSEFNRFKQGIKR